MDSRRRAAGLVLLAAVVTGGAGLALGAGAPAREHPRPVTRPVTASTEAAALRMLHRWDRSRAEAWAAGDRAALAALYAPGSAAGRVDGAKLRGYLGRGLRVQNLATQLVELRVLRRTPRRLVLEVTERLAGGRAVGRGVRVPLPRGQPARHRIGWLRTGGSWRVAWVRRG